MNKTELRACIKQKKKEYSSEELAHLSATICREVEQHPLFQSAQTVLLYHALPDEVQTQELIHRWHDKKLILLPVVVGDELEIRCYQGNHNLHTGAFRIQEPEGAAFTEFSRIDLAIIPGVAFDRQNNRLGRGKGYYDRLLSRLRCHHIYTIGLAYDFQRVESIPCEPHDIPMNEVL